MTPSARSRSGSVGARPTMARLAPNRTAVPTISQLSRGAGTALEASAPATAPRPNAAKPPHVPHVVQGILARVRGRPGLARVVDRAERLRHHRVLTRRAIVERALELGDAEGLEAVSLRRLAAEL